MRPLQEQDMKKTFAAMVAVATVAGALNTTPAHAQRGVAAGVAAGLIGGAIIGGAIASSPPAARPRARGSMGKKLPIRPAAWCASASGTVMAGASAATRSATKRPHRESDPGAIHPRVSSNPAHWAGFFA